MDTMALACLILSTGLSLLVVPDVGLADLIEPTVQAAVGTPFVLTALVALRVGAAPPIWERRVLALFLLLMPTIYLGALALHGGSPAWLGAELAGQAAFATIAIVGLRRSGWVLVAGLAAHGLLWDLWHHGRASFMPDWYSSACLIVDVGWALYAASRVRVWGSAAAAERPGRLAYASRVSPVAS
jgi:hypothetical protein